MSLIFVAGPYSAETDDGVTANIARACEAGKALLELGHWPFVPHVNVAFDLWHEDVYGERMNPEIYYAWDLAILERCDGLLFLDSSPGADRELALAKDLGLVIWMDVGDVPRGETP